MENFVLCDWFIQMISLCAFDDNRGDKNINKGGNQGMEWCGTATNLFVDPVLQEVNHLIKGLVHKIIY